MEFGNVVGAEVARAVLLHRLRAGELQGPAGAEEQVPQALLPEELQARPAPGEWPLRAAVDEEAECS
jgi:hypothetical protein